MHILDRMCISRAQDISRACREPHCVCASTDPSVSTLQFVALETGCRELPLDLDHSLDPSELSHSHDSWTGPEKGAGDGQVAVAFCGQVDI